MNPLGHALAQLVPIYGYFRFLAHMRTLDELLEATGATPRVDAVRSTIAFIAISVFAAVANSSVTPTWLIFPGFTLYGALVAWHQRGLNAYYDRASGGTVTARVHPAEWIVIVVGTLFLGLAAIGSFRPA